MAGIFLFAAVFFLIRCRGEIGTAVVAVFVSFIVGAIAMRILAEVSGNLVVLLGGSGLFGLIAGNWAVSKLSKGRF